MKIIYVFSMIVWTIALSSGLIEYIDEELETPMKLITIDANSSSVIVSARNKLYSFNNDLKPKMKVTTGPKLDHPDCSPDGNEPCDKERKPMDNDPKVLAIVGKLLYTCGSIYQGLCQISMAYSIESSVWSWNKDNKEPNYVGSRESTFAFFGSGTVPEQMYLYVATTYDDRPLEYAAPAVSSKRLRMKTVNDDTLFFLNYTYETNLARTAVNFHPDFKRSYKVNYVYGFDHKGFIYFVTTQRVSVISEAIETRLARVCGSDPTFLSYTEIALKCHRGDAYNLATAAYLGPVGPELKTRLKMNGSKDALYITFVRTIPDHSYLVDKSKGTVLCSFPMSQVISHFTNATRDCFNAEPRTRLLPHIMGEDRKCQNHSRVNISEVLCGSRYNHFIEGREAIPGGVRGYVDEHVTSLAVTLQLDKTVAFLGTERGNVMKLMLERRSGIPLYIENIASGNDGVDPSIQKSNIFTMGNDYLFLLTGRKVVKFPAGSCSIYKTCGQCLGSEDPLKCGWCGSYCAHYNECNQHGLFTREFCKPVIDDVKPLAGPTDGGTLVTITGDNFSSSESGEATTHVLVSIAGVECDIISWEQKKLQCKTASVKKEVSGPVEIRVLDRTWSLGQFDINGTATSNINFSFLVPRLSGGTPTYGIVYGGTQVNLLGWNLDIGSSHQVMVAGVECRNVSLESKKVTCYTGKSNEPAEGPFEMTIDETVITPKGNFLTFFNGETHGKQFRYMPNPEIHSIYPQATTASGTVNITVLGTHLDSVYRPIFEVFVTAPLTGKILRFKRPCTVQNSTWMICPTPPLNDTELYPPTERVPILTHTSFKMDGLNGNATDPRQLLYYPDPVFFPFKNSPMTVTSDQTELEIKGNYVDLVLTPGDVTVLIDDTHLCRVIRMTRGSLHCLIPPMEELANNGPEHSVKVSIDPLEFNLGTIEFVEKETSTTVRLVSVTVTLLVIAGGVCLFFLLRKRMKRKRKLPGYLAAYSEATEDTGANDYTACGATRQNEPRRPALNEYTATQRSLSVPPVDGAPSTLDDETIRLLECENIMVDRQYLTLGEPIGIGNFGCVYKGILAVPGKEALEVAVKSLRRKSGSQQLSPEMISDFLDEGLMMKDFKHPNVLGLVAVCLETTKFPLVITPYMKYGDLHTFIGDESRDPPVSQLLNFGIDIAKGMAYLAGTKFVHRDLAARNCMLGEDMVVRVADFGLSRDIYEREYYSSDNKKKLPVKWMAIESLEKGIYTSSTDVWSYGVVLWELMTRGVLPYPEVDNWDIVNFLKSGRRMLQPYCCPDLVYIIMLRCWNENSSQRPTFSELVTEMQSAVLQYEMESQGKEQKVGLKLQYVNCPSHLCSQQPPSAEQDQAEC